MARNSLIPVLLLIAFSCTESGFLKAPTDKYLAYWTIENNELNMIIICQTTGWVGFGVSPSGTMAGADIFIGGVNNETGVYGFDMFAGHNGAPALDTQQDVTINEITEVNGETTLNFRRPLNATDLLDLTIPNADIYFIFAFGETDSLSHHGVDSRGAALINFFDPLPKAAGQ